MSMEFRDMNLLKAFDESEERYYTLFYNSPLGIVIVDIDGLKRAVAANQKWLDILGYTETEIYKNNMLALSPKLQPDGIPSANKLRDIVQKYKKDKVVQEFEWQFKKKNGASFWTKVIWTSINWYGSDCVMIIAHDIDKLKKQEIKLRDNMLELEQKNEALKAYIASNKQLKDFAHMTSHDLKQPANTIKGFAQILKKKMADKMDDKECKITDTIITVSDNMTDLIDGLLHYATANNEKIKTEELSIQTILNEMTAELNALITSQNANIIFDNLPCTIMGNKVQIRQLFQNLISNAIKYKSPHRKPVITISAQEKNEFWEFEVKDNGLGIRKKNFSKIFQLFKKLHNDDTLGTGIGLNTAKNIVENHGGEIWLTSEYGKGTSFYFTILKNSK